MEEYEGPKFIFRAVDRLLPEIDVRRYLEVDSRLGQFLDPEENEGNMSMRLQEGFLIKRAGARMTRLSGDDVSWVLESDGEVLAAGAEPSSEAKMHHHIYNAVPEAMVVLHFHDDRMLERFEGAAIGPFPYGTEELAAAAGEAAKEHRMFMIKEHGFVLIAEDEEELLERMKTWKG
jgi:ribulose-5-phosphate 4-epimerase/fuculose-1-phosphate aldolase